MIHLFALSKALRVPVQSYCPPISCSVRPYTIYVYQSAFEWTSSAAVMWTSLSLTAREPNHIVLLVPCQPSTGLFHRNGQPVEDCIADNAGEPMDETVARPSTSLTVNEVGAHSTIQKQSKCWHWIWRTATPTAVQTWTNRPTVPRVIDSSSNKGYTLLVDSHCFSYCKTLTRGSKVYWRCNQQTKSVVCQATVIQDGGFYPIFSSVCAARN